MINYPNKILISTVFYNIIKIIDIPITISYDNLFYDEKYYLYVANEHSVLII